MKAFVVDKKSWHYRLIASWERPRTDQSLCSYTTLLIKTVGIYALMSSVCLMALYFVGQGMGIASFILLNWELPESPSPGGSFALMILLVVLGLFLIASLDVFAKYCIRKLNAVLNALPPPAVKEPKPPGFISSAWTALKTKTCVPIRFED